jgi:hypothetical protein
MNKICVGTIGFSYKDWQSVFYPAEMNLRNYITYYSRIYNCVEISPTFLGDPNPLLLAVFVWISLVNLAGATLIDDKSDPGSNHLVFG